MRPLRLAVVTASASRLAGGLFTSVRRLAQSLAAAGHAVEVFALDDVHGAEDAAAWWPLVPRRFPRRGPAALGHSPALAEALAEAEFDVVHQHGIWQGFSRAVSAWRRRTGGAVMISPRGMLDPWAVANSAWKKRLAGALYENANLAGAAVLHALCAAEAEALRGYGLRLPIARIPNGTDLPDDGCAAERPSFLPADGRRTLLFLGRIHPKKGAADLVDAYARLKAMRPQLAASWRVVVAGWDDGGHLCEVARRVDAHGLGGDVALPGPLFGAAKEAALRHADAFVLPSRSEGLPMAVLEAWAFRLPVAMTDACNLPEGFAHGAAYRIELGEAFADHLAALFSAGDLLVRGAAGRGLVEARFGWAGIARRHEAVFRAMCGDPRFVPPAGIFAEAELR